MMVAGRGKVLATVVSVSVSRGPNRRPVTMKRAVIPRRTLEKFQHVSVAIEVGKVG